MSNDETNFSDIHPNGDGPAVNFANNASTKSRSKETVRVSINNKTNITLKDTLLVSDLRTNLMSVAKITDNGLKIIFRETKVVVIDAHGNTVMVAKRKNNLYLIPEAKEIASARHENRKC